MADSRRWLGSGVRRDDQFVRPPAFRDTHEGEPLSARDATWHGSGSRHLALGVALAFVAGIAAVAFMVLASPGADVAPPSTAAAQGDDDPIDPIDVDVPAGVQGNGTTGLPTLPSLPPLPA